jgi:hypothetical protein
MSSEPDISGNNTGGEKKYYSEVFDYIENNNDIIQNIKEFAIEKKDTLIKDNNLDLESFFNLYGENKATMLNIIRGFMQQKNKDITDDDIDKLMVSMNRNQLKGKYDAFLNSPDAQLLNRFK